MKKRFKVSSEGDCEALAKVFIQWLKTDSPKLRKKQIVEAPSEEWASLFSGIYADEISNNDLAVEAESNIIQVEFNVIFSKDRKFNEKLSDLSQEDLMDLLQEYLDNGHVDQMPDDDFTFEGDDSDDDEDDDA